MNEQTSSFSLQYFPEAILFNPIPSCFAQAKSGEYFPHSPHFLRETLKVIFTLFQLPLKPDAQMNFIEALKK